ncbi:nuclear receptor 2C2-associated protein [Nilaparvata lugens]|uniref:nuclear receptor 2C2-associated protein n=1 Tax=Nilaparvata lugens TaxID=108931 RepID=UPI000B994462|nr:nuclear receptor 2C2-associated protein [Nilaparvata lugens]
MENFKCRVSSVQNRALKMYGSRFMFDVNEETCWSSDQGSPQWVELQSKDGERKISSFSIQFQGGFAGKDCFFEVKSSNSLDIISTPFYPDDVNTLQHFSLQTPVTGNTFIFKFTTSTDFFGRIVIYKLVVNE